jgi:putative transposase
MARPLRIHFPGTAYHVYSRGDDKGLIFHEDADYEKLLSLLHRALDRFGAECVAYALMDNHFHLLLIPHEHSVSRIMQYVNGWYAQWFNRKYGRVGHVFQGRFGSKIIEDGLYLLTPLRYIALNPVEGGLVRQPEDWRWSSHRATAGLEPAPTFLSLERVWAAVNCENETDGRRRYLDHIAGGADAEYLRYALFFGGERLARQLAPRLVPYRSVIAHSYAERYAVRPPIDRVFLNADSKPAVKRAIVEAFQVHAYTLAEIGGVVGRDPSTVSKWIKQTLIFPWTVTRVSIVDGRMPSIEPSG